LKNLTQRKNLIRQKDEVFLVSMHTFKYAL